MEAIVDNAVKKYILVKNILPIEWLSIEAKWQGLDAQMRWASIENNNHHFEIEKYDGSSFQKIGTVSSLGTGEHQYDFLDVNAKQNIAMQLVF